MAHKKPVIKDMSQHNIVSAAVSSKKIKPFVNSLTAGAGFSTT